MTASRYVLILAMSICYFTVSAEEVKDSDLLILSCPTGTVGYDRGAGLVSDGHLDIPDVESTWVTTKDAESFEIVIPSNFRGVRLNKEDVKEGWQVSLLQFHYEQQLNYLCNNTDSSMVRVPYR